MPTSLLSGILADAVVCPTLVVIVLVAAALLRHADLRCFSTRYFRDRTFNVNLLSLEGLEVRVAFAAKKEFSNFRLPHLHSNNITPASEPSYCVTLNQLHDHT